MVKTLQSLAWTGTVLALASGYAFGQPGAGQGSGGQDVNRAGAAAGQPNARAGDQAQGNVNQDQNNQQRDRQNLSTSGQATDANSRDANRRGAEQRDAERRGADRRAGEPGEQGDRNNERRGPGGDRADGDNNRQDARLAVLLIPGNHEEVELGRFAQQRASGKQAKEFAEHMVEAHREYIGKLQQFIGANRGRDGREDRDNANAGRTGDTIAERASQALNQATESATNNAVIRRSNEAPQANNNTAVLIQDEGKTRNNQVVEQLDENRRQDVNKEAASDANEARQRNAADAGQVNATAGANTDEANRADRQRERAQRGDRGDDANYRQAARGGDLLALHRQVSERCLQLTKHELSEKQGEEFDTAYLAQQFTAHVGMLAKLEIFREHASSDEFRKLVDEGIETTKGHMNYIRMICNDMKKAHQGAAHEHQATPKQAQPKQ